MLLTTLLTFGADSTQRQLLSPSPADAQLLQTTPMNPSLPTTEPSFAVMSGPEDNGDFTWWPQWPSEMSDTMEWSAQFFYPAQAAMPGDTDVFSLD